MLDVLNRHADFEIREIARVDLIEWRIARVTEIAAIGWPFALLSTCLCVCACRGAEQEAGQHGMQWSSRHRPNTPETLACRSARRKRIARFAFARAGSVDLQIRKLRHGLARSPPRGQRGDNASAPPRALDYRTSGRDPNKEIRNLNQTRTHGSYTTFGDATFHVVSLPENLFATYTIQSRCRILPAHGWPGTGFPARLQELVVDDIAIS